MVEKKKENRQDNETVWVSFGKYKLLQTDKVAISKGQWLSDNHIMIAQILIKEQFPHLNGLESTLYQNSKPIVNALQVVHVNMWKFFVIVGNHMMAAK